MTVKLVPLVSSDNTQLFCKAQWTGSRFARMGRALLLIDQLILESALAHFKSQMCLESSVAFEYCSCLKLVMWLLFLKGPSVRQKYSSRLAFHGCDNRLKSLYTTDEVRY